MLNGIDAGTDCSFCGLCAMRMSRSFPSQGMGFEGFMGASLDHALWFHRPVRVDDWLFLDLHAVSNSNSRGLVRGTMHDRAGRLVMSLTQEALLRAARPGMPPPPPPAPPEVP